MFVTKSLDTIVKDIYGLLGSGNTEIKKTDVSLLSDSIAKHISRALEKREPTRGFRASSIGISCDRKSWYMENTPELEEQIEPWTQIKFLFGHIYEELILFLAEQAGHSVKGRQDQVIVDDVPGHPDAIIDGVVVDVKTANSRGMDKFRRNALRGNDPFGYMDQLGFYYTGLVDTPDVTTKDKVAFLACDKELGHIVLDTYEMGEDTKEHIHEVIAHKKKIVAMPEPPPRGFMAEPDGKSGNMQLCMECRYCPYKHTCWPGLRTFLYSNGPRFLTRVVKKPEVTEI